MNKREKLAFAVVAALAMSSGGFAVAQSVNNVSSDQVIYACVTGVNGNIVRVSNTRKTCPRGTTPIQWNAVGPRGEQGLPGSAVAKGDKGDTGPQGVQGLKGDPGLDGQGSSTPGVYLTNPSGEVYPIISTAMGATVKIGDHFWSFAENSIKPFPIQNYASIAVYEEEGCSSKQLLYTPKSFGVVKNAAYPNFWSNTTSADGYALNRSSQVSFSDVQSVMYKFDEWIGQLPPFECVNIDSAYYEQSVSRWMGHIKQNLMRSDLVEGVWGVDLRLDFANCSYQSAERNDYVFPPIWVQHSLEGCIKPGDQSSVVLPVLKSFLSVSNSGFVLGNQSFFENFSGDWESELDFVALLAKTNFFETQSLGNTPKVNFDMGWSLEFR